MRSPTWIIAFIRCWHYENRVFLFFSYTVLHNVRWHLFWCLKYYLLHVFGVNKVCKFFWPVIKSHTPLQRKIKKDGGFQSSLFSTYAACLCDLHKWNVAMSVCNEKCAWFFFFTVNYTSSSSTRCHCISSLGYLVTNEVFNTRISTGATHGRQK